MSLDQDNMARASNTAEILTKQFRDTMRRNNIDSIDCNDPWSWKRFKQELINFFVHDESTDDEVNELFPKYRTRLQNNFFVSLLMLNIIFNLIVMVVAFLTKSSHTLTNIYYGLESVEQWHHFTVLMTMIFSEYGTELLQMYDDESFSKERIRPTVFIIIANHILLPFPSRKPAIVSTILIIILELIISLRRFDLSSSNVNLIIRFTISDFIFYLYATLFGLYMSRLLEIITKKAFKNHHKYIKSKFNIYQEQEQQERLLNSCFPRHLIEDVRKDLKETIRVLDKNVKIIQSPFKKLYVKKYDNVSVLYADIVNSMLLTTKLNANELVETLNEMFGSFDECADRNKCLRIKLLGDCYYCVSGLPKFDPQHAFNCVRMGLDMIDIINGVRSMKNININMRIGIHSGMVLSGIIGVHKWQFDIWSEDSILASSMEHNGVPGFVHITQETLDELPEIAQQKFIIEERNVNDRLGYLIKRKKSCNSLEQINSPFNNQKQANRLKENVSKLRRRSSFSTVRLQNLNLFQESREVDKGKAHSFIEQEVEQMPLSFKSSSNFSSLHGIHPVFLTFKESKSTNVSTEQNGEKQTESSNETNGRWSLEKEFLTQDDEFFIFYLSFSLVLCICTGLVKCFIIPKTNSMFITGILFAMSLVWIFVCAYFSYFHRPLSFFKRNLIWFGVSISLLVFSLHDILQFDGKRPSNNPEWFDGLYLWSHTNCAILTMTGVSVFIRINLWLKCVLHFAGLFAFFGLLLNQCSIYQILMLHQDLSKQWVSYAGFDATFSHFYYVFMVVSILCIIDRQVEYIFRLDFKLSKRLEHEDQESHIMSEINEILLKNILPAYVAQKFLNNSLTLTDDFYSESYQFCAVMFASIPNYSDFYSEDILNGDGIKCLQLLNEIICDFDQHLSDIRFLRIEKIKTIGSTYMAAAGLQPGRGSNGSTNSLEDERAHVLSLLRFAIKLMETLKSINKDALQDFKLRIGIAVGPVVAGIVGASKPQYDIWGDTVNVASRMESTGVIGRIQITCETAQIVTNNEYQSEFQLEQRGPIQVKGKGNLVTYLVKSKYDFEEKEITYV
ncbi:adenylyl cyclase class-4 guanylyl cyclase [Blomia tropicalis]|nr:adenylyl cyclase class-4 guanylyl cyclase [Blomia tropicalis]